MKKTITILLFISILFASLYAEITQNQKDMLANVFAVNYEVVIIICYDGTVFGYTDQQAGGVFLRLSWLRNKLQSLDKTMDDIEIIVHNHSPNKPLCRQFSPSDRKQFQILKNKGFSGLYALWVNGEIVQTIQ